MSPDDKRVGLGPARPLRTDGLQRSGRHGDPQGGHHSASDPGEGFEWLTMGLRDDTPPLTDEAPPSTEEAPAPFDHLPPPVDKDTPLKLVLIGIGLVVLLTMLVQSIWIAIVEG